MMTINIFFIILTTVFIILTIRSIEIKIEAEVIPLIQICLIWLVLLCFVLASNLQLLIEKL